MRKDRKVCTHCNEEKPRNEFYSRKYKRKGCTVITLIPQCKKCKSIEMRKHNLTQRKYTYTPKYKATKAVDDNIKRCHMCLKYKPGSQYRKYLFRQGKYEMESNWCKDCEKVHGKYTRCSNEKIKPTVNTSEDSKYLCAFIGNVPYEDICKVYGIRYEEISKVTDIRMGVVTQTSRKNH